MGAETNWMAMMMMLLLLLLLLLLQQQQQQETRALHAVLPPIQRRCCL